MTSAVLSPSEGLISRHLTHWIKVALKGKGGSKDHLGRGWTYLAAWDIQERIKALDFVELSLPTIYRALKSLIARGWFVREKMNAGRYRDQTYHYTFGDNHPEQSNASVQSDGDQVVKLTTSKLRVSPLFPPSNSHKTEDIRPSTAEQPDSLDKEELVSQPLQAISSSAPADLLEELKEIEANYRRRKAELTETQKTPQPPSAEKDRPTPPSILSTPSGAPVPPTGSVWSRIRALASKFDPSASGRVSPRSVITRDGTRYRVEDGSTSPLR